MKNKIIWITPLFLLISCQIFAQKGHSINSNSIIRQIPRITHAPHSNPNAGNHAINRNVFDKPKPNRRDNPPRENIKVYSKDRSKNDEDTRAKRDKLKEDQGFKNRNNQSKENRSFKGKKDKSKEDQSSMDRKDKSKENQSSKENKDKPKKER